MTTRRPNDLQGLLLYWLKLSAKRVLFWVKVVVLVVVALVVLILLLPAPEVRVGTFNIENYPRSEVQMVEAVEYLGALGVDIVGVQEITNPGVFREATAAILGERWDVEFADQCNARQKVGVVYDWTAVTLLEVQTHCDTAIHRGARATLEARFQTNHLFWPRTVRVFVVHLKAGGGNEYTRRRQLDALWPLVQKARLSGDEVILLGDFNSTGLVDRVNLEAFSESLGLEWSSQGLGCTSYWDRYDRCQASALDHIFSSRRARSIEARGPCKTLGCETRSSCPVYVDRISDHCPVTAVY